jgi:quinol monooxygenase YgiN
MSTFIIVPMLAAAVLAGASAPSRAKPLTGAFPIVELRQYTLHDGMRDTLIDLFERQFIESQEALGMKVVGTFRDVDRPNRFVWIRAFRDMDARLSGESAFYGGPVWQAHRNEANATMIDSDNVLLLHAPDAGAAFKPEPARPALGEKREAHRIVATIYYLKGDPAMAARRFQADVAPGLSASGVRPLAWFITETAANNFPRLPVREGERVLVWFARFSSDADLAAHKSALDKAAAELAPELEREPEILRLEPTQRSELR